MKKNGYLKKISILFFIGFLVGIATAFFMKDFYMNSYYTYFETASKQLIAGKIHYGLLFFKTFKRIIIPFLLVIALSVSPAYLSFIIAYTIYIGCTVGYFIESLFITFQIRGILYGILYGMPQILIYVPSMLLLMYFGYQISNHGQKKKGLLEKVVPLGTVLFLLLVGALLETFVNSYIMQKTIFLVS